MTVRTRISFGIAVLLAGTLAAGFSVPGRAGDASNAVVVRPAAGPMALKLNEPARIAVKSKGVVWKGNTFHLLSLHEAEFQLGARPHLKGRIKGSTVTFDDVDYEVHAAVFGKEGELLGTAKALQPVERVWLGKPLTSPAELTLDFGISEAYRNATTFSIAISDRKVLTPDQWAK